MCEDIPIEIYEMDKYVSRFKHPLFSFRLRIKKETPKVPGMPHLPIAELQMLGNNIWDEYEERIYGSSLLTFEELSFRNSDRRQMLQCMAKAMLRELIESKLKFPD